MATYVLGVVGAGVGSLYGQPMLGWSIGSTIGGYIDAQANAPHTDVGQISDLRYSGSAFGASLPRVWGRARLGGNIVWVATDAEGNHLVEHTREESQGGKGAPPGGTVTVHWYTATLAVAVCQASIFCPDPAASGGGTFVHRAPTLKRVWADDVLLYDSASSSSSVVPAWHDGAELQSPDSVVIAAMGVAASAAPAWPGLAYAVFQDLNLEPFGNRIPNLSFEVETAAVTWADVWSDLCRSGGVLASELDGSAGTGTVGGFVSASRGAIQNDVDALLAAAGLGQVEADGKLRLVARGGAPVLRIAETDLGASTGETVPLRSVRGTAMELPGRMEVQFYDALNAGMQGNVSVVRQSADVQNVARLNLPCTLTEATARAIAGRELDRRWTETERYSFSLPPRYLRLLPGDVVTLPTDHGDTRVRIVKASLAPIGELRVEAVADEDGGEDQPSPGSGGPSVPPPGLVAVPSVWRSWSGTELRDEDRRSAGFYVAASGGAGWGGCRVYYSLDGGTEYLPGPTITGRSVFGVATSALGSSGAVADAFDVTNTVGVDVSDSFGRLEGASDSAVLAGSNHALLGSEILGVGGVGLTGPGLYTLSRLRRGERGTPMTGHASGEKIVMLTPDLARVSVPASAVGTTVRVKCVSRYQSLTDVTAYTEVVIAPRAPTLEEETRAAVSVAHWLAPVVLVSTSSTLSWSAFDLSSYGVPGDATMAILEAEAALDGPDSGDVDAHIRVRPGGTSFSGYLVVRGRAKGGDDGVAVSCPPTAYPVARVGGSATLEIVIEAPGFDMGAAVRLVGYYAPLG